jgi:hypothetical protein
LLLYQLKNTNAVFSLYRRAAYKGFMLDNYIEELEGLQKELSNVK